MWLFGFFFVFLGGLFVAGTLGLFSNSDDLSFWERAVVVLRSHRYGWRRVRMMREAGCIAYRSCAQRRGGAVDADLAPSSSKYEQVADSVRDYLRTANAPPLKPGVTYPEK